MNIWRPGDEQGWQLLQPAGSSTARLRLRDVPESLECGGVLIPPSDPELEPPLRDDSEPVQRKSGGDAEVDVLAVYTPAGVDWADGDPEEGSVEQVIIQSATLANESFGKSEISASINISGMC